MKQTAVEFAEELIKVILYYLDDDELERIQEVIDEAKEIENDQKDNYAINFLEWFDKNCYARGESSFLLWDNDDEPLTLKELLEKFKNK